MTEAITFPAQVVKVQTLADSGLRLTLDLPESEIVAFAWLAQCKRDGVTLDVTCDPSEKQIRTDVESVETWTIGESERQTKERAASVRTATRRGQPNRYRGRQAASR